MLNSQMPKISMTWHKPVFFSHQSKTVGCGRYFEYYLRHCREIRNRCFQHTQQVLNCETEKLWIILLNQSLLGAAVIRLMILFCLITKHVLFISPHIWVCLHQRGIHSERDSRGWTQNLVQSSVGERKEGFILIMFVSTESYWHREEHHQLT